MPDTITDPEVRLALLYVPAAVRGPVAALFALDARMAGVVERAREPMLAAIKLAWWRERIEALGTQAMVPDEPILRALPHGDAGGIAGIIEGWEAVLRGEAVAGHAARGAALFGAAGRLLAAEVPGALTAGGATWALVNAARRGASTLAAAREGVGRPAWPKALRPLGMLALLAQGDARGSAPPPQGTPARAARMAWHRVSGR